MAKKPPKDRDGLGHYGDDKPNKAGPLLRIRPAASNSKYKAPPSKAKSAPRVGNPYGADMDRRSIQRLGDHLAETGAASIEREDVDSRYWTAAYRVNVVCSWEELSVALSKMEDDSELHRMIGRSRGCQIICEFQLGSAKRGRAAIIDYASLSAAVDIGIALSQAQGMADEWAYKYKDSVVIGVIFYFR